MTSWTLHPRRLTAGTWEYGPPLKEENHLAPNHHDFSFELSIFRGCSWIYILPQPRMRSPDLTTRMTWFTYFRLQKWIPRRPFINPNDTPNNKFLEKLKGKQRKPEKKLNHCRTLKTLGLNVSLKGFDTFNLGQTKIPSSQFQLSSCFVFWAAIAGTQMEK